MKTFIKEPIIYDSMSNLEFFFYELSIKPISDDFDLVNKCDILKKETDDHKPTYLKNTEAGSRVCIDILDKKVLGKETFFSGKIIKSQEPKNFKIEDGGQLNELELQGDTAITNNKKDIIYFTLYINTTSNKYVVALEYQPFSISIGIMLECIKNHFKTEIKEITAERKFGKDLIDELNAVSGDKLTLAIIRFKKNVPISKLKQLGYVEDAIEHLKEKNLDFTLKLHWGGKDEKITPKEFITQFFRIHDFTQLEQTNFFEFMKTLQIKTDNITYSKINFMDKILRFEFKDNKEKYNDDRIFGDVIKFLQTNINNILGD